MDIHPSAYRHGIEKDDIFHAAANAIAVVDLEPEADPPKILAVGPDQSANLIEIILLELDDDELLVIHAMALRATFHNLLP